MKHTQINPQATLRNGPMNMQTLPRFGRGEVIELRGIAFEVTEVTESEIVLRSCTDPHPPAKAG